MKKTNKSAWNVKEKLFPKNGGLGQKIKFLVRYGILAPSGHNSQPWIFEIKGSMLTIKPDYERVRPSVDPSNRELFISLGAAAKNVEVAANYFGMVFEKRYLGETIIIKFKEGKKLSSQDDLFRAITKRHTSREEFRNDEVEKETIDRLKDTPRFRLITPKERKEVANLVHSSVLVWYRSKEITSELEEWLRDDIEMSKDGLPLGVLNLYKLASEVKYLVSRDSLEVKDKALKDQNLARQAPILGVIVSELESVEEWLKSGEAYEEMALELVNAGLDNGFFNTVLELGGQREKLRRLLKEKRRPQLLIRAGYGIKEAGHTPRRPVDEVIQVVT